MKWSTLILSIICPAVITYAATDSFYLTTEKGEQIGPFDFKEGSTLNIAKKEYTVSKILTAKQKIEEVLKTTLIPAIDFRDTSLENAVDTLNKALVSSDTVRPTNQGVLTIIISPVIDKQKVKHITFSARNISVREALQICTNFTKTKWRICDNTVQIIDPNITGDPMITRQYTVFERSGCIETVPNENADEETQLKQFFKGLGVEWPEGSSIKHIKAISQLVVRNTEENLEQLEKALALLNVEPSQIEIEVQYVEYEISDIAAITQNGITDIKALNLLKKQGKGKLLYAPKVVAKAGQEATVKGVTEIIYPTQFDACATTITNVGNNASNTIASCTTAIVPGNFETREIGALLTVTPNVDPSGTMIDLTLCPEIVTEPEWKNYSFTYSDIKGKEHTGHAEIPFFHARKLSTSISVKNGETIVMGGGMPGKDVNKVMYAFVTARLIKTDGKPIKTDHN